MAAEIYKVRFYPTDQLDAIDLALVPELTMRAEFRSYGDARAFARHVVRPGVAASIQRQVFQLSA
jgi:hypothetical protein